MAGSDIGILSETWMAQAPRFAWVGQDAFVFHDSAVARPRFAPKLCRNFVNDGGTAATAIR